MPEAMAIRIESLFQSKYALWILMGISLVIKIGTVIVCSQNPVNPDGVLYISAARQISQGAFQESLNTYPVPTLPLFIAVAHLIIPDWVLAGRVLSAVMLVLCLVPLHRLAQELFDTRVAFWSSVAFMLIPAANDWAVMVIRGPAYLFFMLWTVFFIQRALKAYQLGYFVLGGLCGAVSGLLRMEGLVVFPVLAGVLLWRLWRRPLERGAILQGVLAWFFIPAGIVVAALWALAAVGGDLAQVGPLRDGLEYVRHGRFLDSYRTIYGQLKELENASPFPRGDQNFAEIARHFLHTIYLLGFIEGIAKMLFLIFLLPLYLGLRGKTMRGRSFPILLSATYLTAVFLSLIGRDYLEPRFLLTPLVLFFPWIGAGLVILLDRLNASSRKVRWCILFGIAFLLLPLVKLIFSSCGNDPVLIHAGVWIKERAALAQARIVTNDIRIPFYAGLDKGYIKYLDMKPRSRRTERFARSQKADLVVVVAPGRGRKMLPKFKYYKKLIMLKGQRDYVFIFAAPSVSL
jgi:hypothetical protein